MTEASCPSLSSIWKPEKQIAIPSEDIVTFVFNNIGKFDDNRPIFIDALNPKNSVSIVQARKIVRQIVRGLQMRGIRDGACVCVNSFNSIWYPLLWLGVIGAGGCVVGTNPASTTQEFIHHFSLTRPELIITQTNRTQEIIEAANRCGMSKEQMLFIDTNNIPPRKAPQSWSTLFCHGEAEWMTVDDLEKVTEELAMYAMTSGTTGAPKAAKISHRYLVAQVTGIEHEFSNRPYQPTQLVSLPIFHAFAFPLGVALPLRLGIPTYFLPRFHINNFTECIRRHSVTDIPVVPPILASLTHLSAQGQRSLRSLRYVICAGAPMMPSIQTKLYDILSAEAVISQCWGTTETGWISIFRYDQKDVSGSVGRLMPNIALKVLVSPEDAKLARLSGEAFIVSPVMFSGYLSAPAASSASFDTGGFYGTGDIVHVEQGKVFHDGRVKEIMKVNGWQVSPSELEALLLQHPLVLDAAVAGIDFSSVDGLHQTLPKAYVVRAAAARVKSERDFSEPSSMGTLTLLTAEEIQRYVATRVTSYKQLTGGVVFVKAIPRTSIGKICRHLLETAERA